MSRRLPFTAVLSLALSAAVTQAEPLAGEAPLRLVVSPAASARGDSIADEAVALVMRHAGRRYTLTREPVARALSSFQAGQYDADMLRFPQFDLMVPGAVRVDPYLLSTTIQSFTRAPSAPPASWAALRAGVASGELARIAGGNRQP